LKKNFFLPWKSTELNLETNPKNFILQRPVLSLYSHYLQQAYIVTVCFSSIWKQAIK